MADAPGVGQDLLDQNYIEKEAVPTPWNPPQGQENKGPGHSRPQNLKADPPPSHRDLPAARAGRCACVRLSLGDSSLWLSQLWGAQ